jgi:non-specific serine/threonine protein kinase/serine/threonine-protein kinase
MTANSEEFRRLRRLFEEFDELAEPERSRRLAELEREDPRLAGELQELLEPAPTLEAQLDDLSRQPTSSGGEAQPEGAKSSAIGPYRLIREIGEGGMGVVYEAEQEVPIRRRVALKLIRAGFGSASVVARFHAERQALAVMSHPGIAQVFDAGTAADGRPYFVMELIDGQPITSYCDTHRLSTQARIQLFAQVCDAVQHAHQKGVIHRDLKPSNILVTRHASPPGAEGPETWDHLAGAVVKVIDFGIARAVEEDRHPEAGQPFTRLGDVIGTPEYMSPEQASGGEGGAGSDIDTRSDVYSLGIVLYELLVGEHPLPRETLRRAAAAEIRRRIREDPTPRPSTRLAKTDERSRAELARARSTRAGHLARELRGDLDVVVLKALAKEREQRYVSAAELAADLRRHLRSEPILATPPRLSYVARRFVRRHRLPVAAAAALLVALVAGLVGTTLGLRRALVAERDARRNLATAEEVSEFLESLFSAADPNENLGEEIRVGDLLREGVERIDALSDQPELQARLLGTLSDVYLNLGKYATAGELAARATAWYRSQPGSEPLLLRVGRIEVAAHKLLGQPEEALERAEELLAAVEQAAGPVASSKAVRADLAMLYDLIGQIHRQRRDLGSAREATRRAVELLEEEAGENYASALNTLALIELQSNNPAVARGHLERSIAEFSKTLPPAHPFFGRLNNNLSAACRKAGELRCAVETAARAVEIDSAALGDAHPNLVMDLVNLAQVQQLQMRYDEASDNLVRAQEMARLSLGDEHRIGLVALTERARTYLLRGAGDPSWLARSRELYEERLARTKLAAPDGLRDRDDVLLGLMTAARWSGDLSGAQLVLERIEAADKERTALSGRPTSPGRQGFVSLIQAIVAAQRGAREEAAERFAEAERLAECGAGTCELDELNRLATRAQYWALMGDRERALASLARSLEHPFPAPWAADCPDFAALRGTPEFEELRRRLLAPANS